MTAQDRGWGNPDAADYRTRHIVTVTAGGVRLAVRREVAHLFQGFIGDLIRTGYRLDVKADDWGYANRCVRGTGPGTSRPCVKSNHSWGLAVDLNAIDNPMTEAHPTHAGQPGHDAAGIHTDMPPGTKALADRWGLRWGANYTGTRKDAMHFEFTGSPADVARYPLGAPTPTPVRPPPHQEDDLTPDQAADLIAIKNYVVDAQARLVAVEGKVRDGVNYDVDAQQRLVALEAKLDAIAAKVGA